MPLPTIAERIDYLRAQKLATTKEKQEVIGYMDYDDHALILPPVEKRKLVSTISGSGMPINDVIFNDFVITPNHENGSFYGPIGQGTNFRNYLKIIPPFVDPMCGLAGAYMMNFNSFRKGSNPDLNYDYLKPMHAKYQLGPGIFAGQHFCQDLQIGLNLGWDGIEKKILKFRAKNDPSKHDFYDGLLMVIDGIRTWIIHNAERALEMSRTEADRELALHLEHLYEVNMKIAHDKPDTFEEACQFILWMQMACRTYNGSGSLGRLDVVLNPYYEREHAAGTLDDETATFLIACLLLRDTGYVQLGGYYPDGSDTTNRVSFLVLNAVSWLKLPSNVGVCVGEGINRDLLRKSVEMQFADKTGNPRFVGMESLVEGLVKNGDVTYEDSRARTNAGCHWLAIPGREFSIMDCVKLNMAVVMDIALREAVTEFNTPTIEQIFNKYRAHMRIAVETLAAGFTFTYENQINNCPELPLDLMCYDVIERGLDASNGGVQLYLWCIDAVALAVVADSIAAIDQRIIKEKRYTFEQLISFLDADWQGTDAEKAQKFFMTCDKYGKGGGLADAYAPIVSQIFTEEVKRARTPKHDHEMVPGIFSWANTIPMGKTLGATANGRKYGLPISHGANPNPGFRQDGAASAMSHAIATVQPAYGNTAPMQIELEPSITREEGGVEMVMALIEDHFAKGGTLINLNVIDADKVREAHKDPSLYPDLVVRVTGFSAYFASLSPGFRQLVVDRILDKDIS